MSTVVEEIRSRERDWIAAILDCDLARLQDLLAPGFVYTASNFGRLDRQEWLDMVPTYHFTKFELADLAIQAYGDVVVTHGRVSQEAMMDDQVRTGTFLVTNVWVKRDGRWQAVARCSVMP
jgi:ketosteroid isomerase-like protein